MMKSKFIYFDLGNVLLRFSTEKAARQAAAVAGCSEEDVRRAVERNNISRQLECGEITEREFYEEFCTSTGCRPGFEALRDAMNDMFEVLEETQPFTRRLAEMDFPRGILSNVGPSHWTHCTETYPFLLEYFPANHLLSYRVGAMKPDRKIYEAAFETAAKAVPGILPEEILFIDDIEANVLGARQFGFDAVPFFSGEQLADELGRRGFDSITFEKHHHR